MHRQNTNNHLDTLIATAVHNHQRRLTPSDCATELTFCNSKTDSWALNINDEITQTETSIGKNSIINGTCTDTERLYHAKDDETTDLIPKSKLCVNYLQPKPIPSNLAITSENPWKKLSNVRYKLDGKDVKDNDSSRYEHVYEQHITFV
jgi:hypothetical protein